MNPWTENPRANATRRLAPALLALALAGCGLFDKREQAPDTTTDAPAEPAPDLGDPAERFNAALMLFKRNQLPAAEQAFIALENDFPQHAGPAINLGLLYLRRDQPERAIGAFSRAEQRTPDNPVIHNGLGVAYQNSGQTGRAEQAWRRAIELNRSYPAPQLNLGMLLEADGRATEALPHYRRYLALVDDEELRVQAWIAAIEARSVGSESALEGTP